MTISRQKVSPIVTFSTEEKKVKRFNFWHGVDRHLENELWTVTVYEVMASLSTIQRCRQNVKRTEFEKFSKTNSKE